MMASWRMYDKTRDCAGIIAIAATGEGVPHSTMKRAASVTYTIRAPVPADVHGNLASTPPFFVQSLRVLVNAWHVL